MAILSDSLLVPCGRKPSTRVSLQRGGATVWLRGEHDIATEQDVADSLARAIALDEADLTVDLSEVDFMDASTISLLVRARTFLRAQNRTLTIRAPSPSACRVMDIVGIGTLLDPKATAQAHPVVHPT